VSRTSRAMSAAVTPVARASSATAGAYTTAPNPIRPAPIGAPTTVGVTSAPTAARAAPETWRTRAGAPRP